ncbi:probable LRR receptor-like serine/threonine-protein kinase At1g05700 isoform X1 [Typha latifolia]|uniref:probable LRR receptor-like serine/threonine-protein kinase At1g05700 isoform X1 n=1 Tax=Typha latifolia TaxID=4733 RepID=UPI003C2E0C1F
MMALFLMLVFSVSTMNLSVHGQQGFLSIDCGYDGDSYSDNKTTGLTYVSDANFIDTGKPYSVPKVQSSDQPTQTEYVRSFPDGDRNCYTLDNINQGAKYLIRASFLYGNYDGEDSVDGSAYISFDLYLGVNFWQTVDIHEPNKLYEAEIVTVASAKYFFVCLKNKKSGVPFISALELRPIESINVFKDVNQSVSLVYWERYNVGGFKDVLVRYPNDMYDRTWKTCFGSRSCNGTRMSTSSLVLQSNGDSYDVPLNVMQTAVDTLRYYLDVYSNGIIDPTYYIYVHLAELLLLNSSESRSFMVTLTGESNGYRVSPTYLSATHLVFNYAATTGETVYFDLTPLNASTLPPILNAVEAYVAIELPDSATDQVDVDAMMGIKKLYQMKQWQGDPCGPPNFKWVGINCTASNPPKVASLNLSSHALTGEIPNALVNLTAIQELDLSNNSLTGTIPEFLANMSSLRLLNLPCNQLSGPIPAALLERQNSGALSLGLENYDHGCYSSDPRVSTDSNSKKLWIILVASIVPGVVILLLIAIWLRRRGRRHQPPYPDLRRRSTHGVTPRVGMSMPSEIRRFSYLEVKAITNNFERVIGRGGFGIVYHGVLEDNTTEVAVKLRSDASAQGTKEFNAEANLSSKAQHENLVSLVGYCAEDDHLALLYPYMAKGSLKDHLFDGGREKVLSWAQRLQIAADAAQGLEFLHTGCAIPIIHRDVKTHNILLTESFEAKIADFGMSKPFPIDNTQSFITASRVVGTDGFLDPEYFGSGQLHEKSDVYSFGIVLLELITGVPAVERLGRGHIVEWVGMELDKHEIAGIVDAKLQGEYEPKSMRNVLKLAMRCTMKSTSERPAMREVVAQLKKSLELEVARGIGSNVSLGVSMEVSETSESDSIELMHVQKGSMSSLTTR